MATKKKPETWFVKKLREMNACGRALRYAKEYLTFPAAWDACSELRWLAWLLRELGFETCPRFCTTCSGLTVKQIETQLRRQYSAERVAKALRKVGR